MSTTRRRLGRLARHCMPTACSGTAGPALKVFVSVDIEGAVGIAHWDEADSRGMPAAYAEFRQRMTNEAAAACRGAVEAGATHWMNSD